MPGRALNDCSIDRAEVYLANVVKHFKFEERGKGRLHKKPLSTEIRACRPWLEAEVKSIAPRCLYGRNSRSGGFNGACQPEPA